MFAFILILFFLLIASEQAQAVAQFLVVAFAKTVWHCASNASATAQAEVVAELQQRLDAQTEKCLELHRQLAEQETKGAVMMERHTTLQRFYAHNSGLVEEYARALAAKERRLEEVDDKLLAAIDDRDAKIEVIASLKYNEEQYQEEIDDLRAELGAQAE
ncbi:hypothetical protein IW139_003389 [Coemansia sp. RSA 353]|nr:hypothetical protein J3F82_000994 [Coemansia sp. RSA 637]KAJ2173156.1 hypothetical protein GGH16_001983 [Coemansia sp. RSA 560]KAJ2195549.1 hypothetical protein GGH18_001888 [Coemansia sp. RSA 530]KAJ2201004.1 hypothetical protein IW145_005157 [Coemansia sp. RSA 521]KAJ2296374.1 hypothetical protein IW139_003389 [Coemansia sp. RSA 353]KAJ2650279.1 hypothetical protein IW137_000895 [Coemansia sp. RSA 1287]